METEENDSMDATRPKQQPRKTGKPMHRTPKKKKENPISSAVSSWLQTIQPLPPSLATADDNEGTTRDQLISRSPKRWVVYEPMVLLPSGSFTAHPWPALLAAVTAAHKTALWTSILGQISPLLTHLAINEGIPLTTTTRSQPTTTATSQGEHKKQEENLLRSPSGLHILHGEFGPALFSPDHHVPTAADFGSAFWVSTKQNGIVQTWAPRYTMFSRGNVKEKARLLADFPHHRAAAPAAAAGKSKIDSFGATGNKGNGKGGGEPEGISKGMRNEDETWVVDLYAGIGYFVFSYAKMGFRLLCWELNPWSVEGLRRGAVANGWDVEVVIPGSWSHQGGGGGGFENERLGELVTGGGGETPRRPQIIVFLESNELAEGRIRWLREFLEKRKADGGKKSAVLDVAHVNCGFLPTSSLIWRDSWKIIAPNQRQDKSHEGTIIDRWLHLHENVGVRDIENRKAEIQELFGSWASDYNRDEDRRKVVPRVEHVEMVKTFAPDVWHVVFDVHVGAGS